jgi:hypothetical protein
MGVRATILGFLLALFMCGYTYYNNEVLQQTFFVSNHLPIGIFSTLLVLLFLVNPLLRRVRDSWALRPAEFAIIGALGLAVCSWPYENGFRNFTPSLALPNNAYHAEAGWRGASGMSYVPGGSPLLAEGFVRDFRRLDHAIESALAGRGNSLARAISARLPEYAKRAAQSSSLQSSDRREIIKGLNELIEGPDLSKAIQISGNAQQNIAPIVAERSRILSQRGQLLVDRERLPKSGSAAGHQRKLLTHRAERLDAMSIKATQRINRTLLETGFAGIITPTTPGSGVLLDDGHDDAFVVGSLVSGWDGTETLSLFELPWDVWWPTIRLWGSVAVLLALAALCIAVIVHPQWTHRELLPYPIVGFLHDIVQTDTPGTLPTICRAKLFWFGLGSMLFLNLINGLHAWFPSFVAVPLDFDFRRILTLFPDVQKVGWTVNTTFQFQLYPIVIAFTYFIRTNVALSIGLSNIAWTLIGVVSISNGISLQHGDLGWNAENLVNFGANLGLSAVILYTGRRYYLNVAASAFGLHRHDETPLYSVWAARGLLACLLLMLYILQRFAGLNWIMSGAIVFVILMASVVMARMNAEGGLFLLGPGFSATITVPTLFGFQALSPSQYFSMSTLRTALWGDPRGAAMPFLLNGLHAAESIGKQPPRRSAPWMAIILAGGFLVAMAVSFLFQYNLGANMSDQWSRKDAIREPFENVTRQVAWLGAHEQLGSVVAASDWELLSHISPDPTAIAWIATGFALVIVFAFLRLRVHWWPIHPMIFAVMGLWYVMVLAPCFLLGWGIRYVVEKIGGAKGYHELKPAMVGIIAGELLSVIAWTAVGTSYYAVTGLTPTFYSILPN